MRSRSFKPISYRNNEDDDLRRYVRNGVMTGWYGWIPAGIIHDIVDTNADWVRSGFKDSVSRYSHQDIFNAPDSDYLQTRKRRKKHLQLQLLGIK